MKCVGCILLMEPMSGQDWSDAVTMINGSAVCDEHVELAMTGTGFIQPVTLHRWRETNDENAAPSLGEG